MALLRIDRLLEFLTSAEFVRGLLWTGLVALGIALAALVYTRWGRSRSVEKCLVLSALLHVWLAVLLTTLHITIARPPETAREVRVALDREPTAQEKAAKGAASRDRPWETPSSSWSFEPWQIELARLEPPETNAAQRQPRADLSGLEGKASLPRLSLAGPVLAEPKPAPAETARRTGTAQPAQPIQAPAAQARPGAKAAVSEPGLDRPTNETGPMWALRSRQPSAPTALLERPLPLPRLSESPLTPEPAPALSAPNDNLRASSAQAAPATSVANAPQAGGQAATVAATAEVGDTRGMDGPRRESAAAHLRPPSLANQADDSAMPLDGAAGSGSPAAVGAPSLPRLARSVGGHEIPEVYRLRMDPHRDQIARQLGSTPEREQAVRLALKWLADNQEPDGRWSAKRHGGGQEVMEAGRDRQGAGSRADTGITGLAILAFAASGNTHLHGSYQETIRRAVDFLIASQAPDGSLGGPGAMYEFMYCHGIATLALSEILGMTGDDRLRQPVARAVNYTLNAQDPIGGGWRYRPQESGDTSQLGWQLMALKSAELAGIPIPGPTWEGAWRFLDSVSGGNHRGLASYRPGERHSRTMTAEALACRLFLGLRPDDPTAREAGDYLLGELPGEGQPNLYYWYYATMAMYQLQGAHWKQWNEALQKALLASQRTTGAQTGSWDPNTRWDGYGGRVYSTALATMCLEAYYRFFPLHAGPASTGDPAR
ncbi:MAG: hypothetical protein NUV77_17770 [Thermoguttaceae bacterium]|jgi:hypothetical protein|nr:hypothetical protein [Thermoguttaceae bacterium]